jgi:hypothetical protein
VRINKVFLHLENASFSQLFVVSPEFNRELRDNERDI